MLVDESITEFSNKTASKLPAPGGGSVSALSGALSASLVSKVCNLTIGKKKYVDVSPEMEKILSQTEFMRKRLMELVDEDTVAFNEVITAYKMQASTDEETKKKNAVIQGALKHAVNAPLKVARESLNVLSIGKTVAEKGNFNAITDVAVGLLLGVTALRGAALNARINFVELTDKEFVGNVEKELREIETKAVEFCGEGMETIIKRLKNKG
jgi:formiminotetrahydrofolate cyclodeaminase